MDVAPLAGAWIEIALIYNGDIAERVAPLAGAWIEIRFARNQDESTFYVAPLAGAWIEILEVFHQFPPSKSLPSRERGLK